MAAVTVTANEVLPDSGTKIADGILGGTVTAGMAVYQDATDSGSWKAADADASAAAAAAKGIALTGGVDGQACRVAIGGTLDPGFTVTVGTIYVVGGAVAGDINPAADLTSNWYTNVLGVGITASQLQLILTNSGVQVP